MLQIRNKAAEGKNFLRSFWYVLQYSVVCLYLHIHWAQMPAQNIMLIIVLLGIENYKTLFRKT